MGQVKFNFFLISIMPQKKLSTEFILYWTGNISSIRILFSFLVKYQNILKKDCSKIVEDNKSCFQNN